MCNNFILISCIPTHSHSYSLNSRLDSFWKWVISCVFFLFLHSFLSFFFCLLYSKFYLSCMLAFNLFTFCFFPFFFFLLFFSFLSPPPFLSVCLSFLLPFLSISVFHQPARRVRCWPHFALPPCWSCKESILIRLIAETLLGSPDAPMIEPCWLWALSSSIQICTSFPRAESEPGSCPFIFSI